MTATQKPTSGARWDVAGRSVGFNNESKAFPFCLPVPSIPPSIPPIRPCPSSRVLTDPLGQSPHVILASLRSPLELHSKKEGVISTKRERENGKEKREKEGERGDFIGERGGREGGGQLQMGVVKQCHRCQRRVLTEKGGEIG